MTKKERLEAEGFETGEWLDFESLLQEEAQAESPEEPQAESPEEPQAKPERPKRRRGQPLPQDIYEVLDSGIVGQDAAKRDVSMIVWDAMCGRRSSNIIVGKTGSGKTEMFRVLQQHFGDWICILDSTIMNAVGWKGGNSIVDILRMSHVSGIRSTIIVFDEIDKKLKPAVGSAGTDYNALFQQNLLKMCDGDKLSGGDGQDTWSVDCSNVTVVFTGAFTSLFESKGNRRHPLGFSAATEADSNEEVTITTEDLISYGMERELAGRIQRIIQMDEPDEETMYGIAKMTVSKLEDEYCRKIRVGDDFLRKAAAESMETALGARYIRRRLLKYIDQSLFEEPGTDTICIETDTISNEADMISIEGME